MVRSCPRPLTRLAPLVIALSGCFTEPPMVIDDTSTGPTGPTGGPETTTTVGSTPTGPTAPTGSDSRPSTDDGTTTAVGSSSDGTDTGPDPDSGSSTEAPPSECEAVDGTPDAACPPTAPFCVGGSCVPCGGGGDCGTLDPSTPVCGADDVCMPCREHAQCPDGAGCHLFEGTCLPSDHVYYVDPDSNCGPNEASEDMPACTLDEVIAVIGAEPMATIHLDDDVYLDDLSVGEGRVYAIIGGVQTTVATNVSPTVAVSGTAYFSSIDIQTFDAFATGIASSGDVWLDDSIIRNLEVGLESTSGRVVLRRSRVLDGSGVGVRLSGDQPATFINTIIANNVDSLGTPGGIVVEGTGPIEILYSTLVDNSGDFAGAIDCGPGSATVRNSILTSLSLSDAVGCGPDTEVTHSVVSDGDFDQMPTNVPLEDIDELLFDAAYGVAGASIAADVARWDSGDPQTDIDGTARPEAPGTADYAGAARPD